MKLKIIGKITVLTISLVAVIWLMRYLSSNLLKENLEYVFKNREAQKNITWCPSGIVKVDWLDPNLSEAYLEKHSSKDLNIFRDRYCTVDFESIQIGVEQIKFKPLLKVEAEGGASSQLDWNPEQKLYKTKQMMFKSLKLSRELLDESR